MQDRRRGRSVRRQDDPMGTVGTEESRNSKAGNHDRKITSEQDVGEAREEESQVKTCPKKDHSFISSRLHPYSINRGDGLSLRIS